MLSLPTKTKVSLSRHTCGWWGRGRRDEKSQYSYTRGTQHREDESEKERKVVRKNCKFSGIFFSTRRGKSLDLFSLCFSHVCLLVYFKRFNRSRALNYCVRRLAHVPPRLHIRVRGRENLHARYVEKSVEKMTLISVWDVLCHTKLIPSSSSLKCLHSWDGWVVSLGVDFRENSSHAARI